MARKTSSREEPPEPWPKPMALRRLKEAGERISGLENLNHRDLNFQAWRDDLSRILRRNWPDESLPHFAESRMRLPREPPVTIRDVKIYREGLAKARAQIERILRDERELAEAQADDETLEVFLAPGTQHDAYQHIRQMVSAATRELAIVDNYVDNTLFQLLTNLNQRVPILVLTYSVPPDFALEGRKFMQQHGYRIEVKRDRSDFHDRFIILDGTKVFHLGHSIKDAGSKAMMIHQLEDQRNVQATIEVFQAAWAGAVPFPL